MRKLDEKKVTDEDLQLYQQLSINSADLQIESFQLQQNKYTNQTNNKEVIIENENNHLRIIKNQNQNPVFKNVENSQKQTFYLHDKLIGLFCQYESQQTKITLKDISSSLLLPKKFILKLYKEYTQDPTFKTRKLTFNSIVKAKNKNMKQIGKRRAIELRRILTINPLLSLKQIIVQLNKQKQLLYPTNFPQQHRLLTQNALRAILRKQNFIKIKIKKDINQNNSEQILLQKYQYSINYKQIQQNGSQIWFVGILKFHYWMNRNTVWSLKGTKPTTKLFQQNKTPMINVLIVLSKRGIVDYSFKEGLWEELQFIKKTVQILNQNNLKQTNYSHYLIFDNSLIFHKQKIKVMCFKRGFKTIFLPSNGQELNPLIHFNHQFKSLFCGQEFSNNKHFIEALQNKIKKYRKQSLQKFYEATVPYLMLASNKKTFP